MKTLLTVCFAVIVGFAQQPVKKNSRMFEQLHSLLPTPNSYRTASGVPGEAYWQQKVDYQIEVEIEDNRNADTDKNPRVLRGKQTVTYKNNSPHTLPYLWFQLDQNMRATNSNSYKISTSRIGSRGISLNTIDRWTGYPEYDGGHKIQRVTDMTGKAIPYKINQTMMRIDLPTALKPGATIQFKVDWYYNINNRNVMGGRGGYEYFADNKNNLYTITQWFPRAAVYDDVNGWQNKQFLGRGEFALEFGDYDVKITVPDNFMVASTGELQNPDDVLTATQKRRFEQAKTAKRPVKIVTLDEAKRQEKTRAKGKKTWHYKAENVRDFAFGASQKFIWDAMGVKMGDRTVMAMSYYLKESYALYERYSTEAVAHTLNTYSEFTFEYPYPVAISVEASNGMEYPMICFNYGRTDEYGMYTERAKYGAIGVIIHEVGHNYFPMIVSSDERQWTWMDEGLNTFLQYITESRWDRNYPHRRGPAWSIVPYMSGDKSNISPIMSNSENIYQFGNNAYGKPATVLNILRETVMGRDLFDDGFKNYSQNWMFKHPEPADFFRSMEDATAFDLDWYWRAFFFTTDHVDISIRDVEYKMVQVDDPEEQMKMRKKMFWERRQHVSQELNDKDGIKYLVEAKPYLKDYYDKEYDRNKSFQGNSTMFDVNKKDMDDYRKKQRDIDAANYDGQDEDMFEGKFHFYEMTFENMGGIPMPLILKFEFEGGGSKMVKIPAEIWKQNNKEVTKVFFFDKKVKQMILDPKRETADTDEVNNYFPRKMMPSKFELFKRRTGPQRQTGGNSNMRKALRPTKKVY